MHEQKNHLKSIPKLFEDLKKLTEKTMEHIASKMEEPDALIKYARQFRNIALTLEKLGKLVTTLGKIEALLEHDKTPQSTCIDNATPRERREQLEATINYFENIKKWRQNYLDGLKEKEASDEQKPLSKNFNNTS